MSRKKFILLPIFLIGFFVRVFGLNWDQGSFLHPDERFLTMVSQSLEMPKSKLDYFNPNISTLNPVNTGHQFYVYGSLPIVVHRILGDTILAETSFIEMTLLGRIMSAIADSLIIILIYKIVRLLEKPLRLKKETKNWAAFIYALLVFPIQISHFFTTDPFLNLFSLTGIYFSLKFFFQPEKLKFIVWSGFFFSLALASKLNAIYSIGLAGALIVWKIWSKLKKENVWKKILPALLKYLLIFILTTYLGLRLFNPGYFSDSNILNPNLNSNFISSIKLLNTWSNSETWFPPSIQWLNKSNWFAGKNLFLYGLGIPVSLLVMVGLYEITEKYDRNKKLHHLNLIKSGLWLILIWLIGFFIWQSIQFVKTMRYLLIIYPWLAIIAAIGVENIKQKFDKNKLLVNMLLIILIVIWPLAFINIYTQKHSRVQASIWLEENLPTNTITLSEYWDDALPVSGKFKTGSNGQSLIGKNKQFQNIELYVFDQDTPSKWLKLNKKLDRGEYYILSSNRAWESISDNPERYPEMSEFYSRLFNNELPYKLIKKIEVRPSLRWLGIPLDFNDENAEEAFTVYDHPTVLIFKKD